MRLVSKAFLYRVLEIACEWRSPWEWCGQKNTANSADKAADIRARELEHAKG